MDSTRYEFRITGRLSDATQRAFPGMVVHDAPPETIIVGALADEAQLFGVLSLIQTLGLRLVSVQQVPE